MLAFAVVAIVILLLMQRKPGDKEIPIDEALLQRAREFKAKIAAYSDTIEKVARWFKVPANLIRAVIWTESSGEPSAIGDQGASFGLMQVQLPAASDVGYYVSKAELLKPNINIEVGTAYLAYLYGLYYIGNWPDALAAYNWGMGKVLKSKEANTPYDASALYYIQTVLKYQKALDAI